MDPTLPKYIKFAQSDGSEVFGHCTQSKFTKYVRKLQIKMNIVR